MFFSSWRKLVQQVGRNPVVSRRGKKSQLEQRKSSKLLVEQLEERNLLSTFQYTGLAGTFAAGPPAQNTANWEDPGNWTKVVDTNVSSTFPGQFGADHDIAQFVNFQSPFVTGSLGQVPQILNLTSNITIGELDFGTAGPEGAVTIQSAPSTTFGLIFDNGASRPVVNIGSVTFTNTSTALISAPITAAGQPLDVRVGGGVLELANTTANSIVAGSSFKVHGGTLNIFGPDSAGASDLIVANTGTISVGGGTQSGTPAFKGNAGTAANISSVTVFNGGTFVIDDQGTTSNTTTGTGVNKGRLKDTAAISLNGGSFTYTSNQTVSSTGEILGPLTLARGTSTITTNRTQTGTDVSIEFASLTRPDNSGATVNFFGIGAALGDPANRILFTAPISTLTTVDMVDSGDTVPGKILTYAGVGTTSVTDLATYLSPAVGTNLGITSYSKSVLSGAPYFNTLEDTPVNGVARLVSSEILEVNQTIGALLLITNGAVYLGDKSLTIGKGTIVNVSGNSIRGETGSNLSSGSSELYFMGAGSTINTNIGGTNAVIAGATGTLTLPLANSYTGATYLNSGTLSLGNNASLGTGTLHLNSGTINSTNSLTLPNAFVMNNSSFTIGGSNNLVFSGTGTITGEFARVNASNDGQTRFTNVLSGTGRLIVVGDAILFLSGANTYSGGTIIGGGLTNDITGGLVAIGSSSSGGTGPFGTGTLTLRAGGTIFADGQARTISNAINLNAPVIPTGFITTPIDNSLTLTASSAGASSSLNSQLTFTGPVNITQDATIEVTDNNQADPGSAFATFSGVVSGVGKLTVKGVGSMALTGNNTYSGGTELNAGSLGAFGTLFINNNNSLGLVTLAETGKLLLTSGRLHSTTAVTVANELRFSTNAFVELAGGPMTFTSAATNAIPTANDASTNGINFTAPARLIVNASTTIDAPLSGGQIILYGGTSTLTLTAANDYAGETIINGGTLVLAGASGALTASKKVVINAGASLILDNTLAFNNNRININAPVVMNGGTLLMRAHGTTDSFESISEVVFRAGDSTVAVERTGSATVELNFETITRLFGNGGTNPADVGSAGGTASFVAVGALQVLDDTNNIISVDILPTRVNGILPYALVKDATTAVSLDLAGVTNSSGVNMATTGPGLTAANVIVANTNYTSLKTNGTNAPTDNVLVLSSGPIVIQSDSINALLMAGTGIVINDSTGNSELVVSSGLVANAAGSNTINVRTIKFDNPGASPNLLSPSGFFITASGQNTISSVISGKSGIAISGAAGMGLGDGALYLKTPNSYTGRTIPSADSVPPTPIWTWMNSGTLILETNGVLTNNADPAVRGGAIAFMGGELEINAPVALSNAVAFGQPSTLDTIITTNQLNDAASGSLRVSDNGATTSDVPSNLFLTGAVTLNGYSTGLDLNNGVNAEQTLTFGGSGINGTFILSLNGFSTAPITYSSDGATLADRIETALTAMVDFAGEPVIGTGNVDVDATTGTAATVKFQNAMGKQFVFAMQVTSSLLGTNPTVKLTDSVIGTGGVWVSGIISGAANLTKEGVATLNLLHNNLYTGVTVAKTGVTNVRAPNSLGNTAAGSGTVVHKGATLQFWGARNPVTNAEPLFISGTGLGGAGVIQSMSGEGNTFSGPINLMGHSVINGDFGQLILSGAISGAGDLYFNGPMRTAIDGDNPHTGNITVVTGIALVSDSGAFLSNLGGITVLDGATLQIDVGGATFSGKALSLNGDGFQLFTSGNLLGEAGALVTTDTDNWTGDITLAGNTTISIDAQFDFTGRISGPFSLTKRGDAELAVGGRPTYTGATNVDFGRFMLTGAGGAFSGTPGVDTTSSITVRMGGALRMNNAGTQLSDRVADAIPIDLYSAYLDFVGGDSQNVFASETVGTVSLKVGDNFIVSNSGTSNLNIARLTINTLNRAVGSTLNFLSVNTTIGSDSNKIIIGAIGQDLSAGGVLPYAIVTPPTGTDVNFATLATGPGFSGREVKPFENYVNKLSTAKPGDVAKITQSEIVDHNITVDAILLSGSTVNVTLGTGGVGTNNYNLNIQSGGVVSLAGTFQGGTVNFGAAEGIVIAATGTANLGTNGVNTTLTGLNGVTFSGDSTINVFGSNSYAGKTIYNGSPRITTGDDNNVSSAQPLGSLNMGTVSAFGNSTLALFGGTVGTASAANFGNHFAIPNSIELNNSMVGLGTNGRIQTNGVITLLGRNMLMAPNADLFVRGAIVDKDSNNPGSLILGRFGFGANTAIQLEGDNTYSGGTYLRPQSTFELVVTSPTAFGTGPIYWAGGALSTGRIVSSSSPIAQSGSLTISNPIFVQNVSPDGAFRSGNSSIGVGTQGNTQAGMNIVFDGPMKFEGSALMQSQLNQTITLDGEITGRGGIYMSQMANTVPGVSSGNLEINQANSFTGGYNAGQVGVATATTLKFGNNRAVGSGIIIASAGGIHDDGIHQITLPNQFSVDNGQVRNISANSATLPFTLTGPVVAGAGLILSATGVGLSKGGIGNLVLTNAFTLFNSNDIANGTLTIKGGGAITNATRLNVNPGGTLVLDNSTINSGDRIANSTPIVLQGGTLSIIGSNSNDIAVTEALGAISLGATGATLATSVFGGSVIRMDSGAGAGASVSLTLAGITRGFGNLLDIQTVQHKLNATPVAGAFNRLGIFTQTGLTTPVTGPGGSDNFMPWATVSNNDNPVDRQYDFGRINTTILVNGAPSVEAFSNYRDGFALATATDIVRLTNPNFADPSNDAGGAPRTIAALYLKGDGIVQNGGSVLAISSGAILSNNSIAGSSGNSVNSGGNPGISFTTDHTGGAGVDGVEGIIMSNDLTATGLRIMATLANKTLSAPALTLGGPGRILMNGGNAIPGITNENDATGSTVGGNAYTGGTVITGGTIILNRNNAFGQVGPTPPVTALNTIYVTAGTIQTGRNSGLVIPHPWVFNNGSSPLNLGTSSVTFSGDKPITLGSLFTTAGVFLTGTGGITVDFANPTTTLTFAALFTNTSSTANQNITLGNYSGTTTVNRGTLVLGNSYSSSSAAATIQQFRVFAGPVVVKTGATVKTSTVFNQITSNAQSWTLDGTLDLSGQGTAAALINNLTMTGGNVVLGQAQLNIGNSIRANAGTGAATLSSITTSTGGLLILTANSLLVNVQPTVNLTISAEIRGTGTVTAQDGRGLLKTGGGSLVFTGTAANIYVGVTNVNEGTLVLGKTPGAGGGTTANAYGGPLVVGNGSFGPGGVLDLVRVTGSIAQLSNSQPIYVANSGHLDISAATGSSNGNQSIGGLEIRGGLVNTGSNAIVLNTATGQPAANVIAYAVAGVSGRFNGKLDVGNAPRRFTVLDNFAGTTTIPGLVMNGPIEGGQDITKVGSGTMRMQGATTSTNSGATFVNEGTLLLATTGQVNEVQRLTFAGLTATPGTFTLLFNGATTTAITTSNNSTTLQTNIQNALDALGTITGGNAIVTLTNPGATAAPLYNVTFVNQLGATDVALMTRTAITPANGTLANPTLITAGVSVFAVQSSNLTIGDNAGGSGVNKVDKLILSSSSQINPATEVTINNSGLMDLNGNYQTVAKLTVQGGTLNTGTGAMTLGGNLFSVANITNQTQATINGRLSLGLVPAATTRTFTVGAGAVLSNLPSFDPTPGTNEVTDMLINAVISGSSLLTLVKDGAGILQLKGNNTYTGPTTIADGTLLVDGSQPNSGLITVNSADSVLGGKGTTGAVTVSSGTVSPGDIILKSGTTYALGSNKGVLTSNGAVTFGATAVLALQVSNLTTSGVAGVDYDKYVTTGLTSVNALASMVLDPTGITTDTGSTATAVYTAGSGIGAATFPINRISFVPGTNPFNLEVTRTLTGVTALNIELTGRATRLEFGAGDPTTVTAGDARTYTVRAINDFNNPAKAYAGTVLFSSSDTKAVFGTNNVTLTAGQGTFLVTLKTTPSQTITISDTATPVIITPAIRTITVLPNVLHHFGFFTNLTGNASTAGSAFVIQVTAQDEFNNTKTDYVGTVHFTSSDSLAGLESDKVLNFQPGIGLFAATLNKAGIQTVSVNDVTTPAIISTTAPITVSAGKVAKFVFSDPNPVNATAGTLFAFQVSARDAFDNTASGYAGTVHFTSNDTTASFFNASSTALPGNNGVLASGIGTFQARLTAATVGGAGKLVTANDVATVTIVSAPALTVNVVGKAANHFVVSAPPGTVGTATTTAGNAVVFQVTAKDEFENTDPNYAGTVSFATPSDPQSQLTPSTGTLNSGNGFFAVILKTSGIQTVTAFDAAVSTAVFTSNNINVQVSSLNKFGFKLVPGSTLAGESFNFTLAAQDQFGNTIPTYTGTAHFTSNDPAISSGNGLPADTAITGGTGNFAATFKTAGAFRTLSATDTLTLSGSSGGTFVHSLEVFSTTVPTDVGGNLTSVSARFNKALDVGIIDGVPLSGPGTHLNVGGLNLYADAGLTGSAAVADFALARNEVQVITFGASVINDTTTFRLIFPPGAGAQTTTLITYSSTAGTLQTRIQDALNALPSIGSGNTQVTAVSATNVRVMFQNSLGFRSVLDMVPIPNAAATVQVLPANVTPGSVALRGSVLLDSDNQGFRFVLTGAGAASVTASPIMAASVYQLTIRSASNGFKDLFGNSLDADNNGTTGDSFVRTFTVATTSTVVLSVPDFARGPDSIANIRIPNGSTLGDNAGESLQKINFTGYANGNTFQLAFNGSTTGPITYDSSASVLQQRIQDALAGSTDDPQTVPPLSSIDNRRRPGVQVVDSLNTSSTTATVRFQNMMGGSVQPLITAATLTGAGTVSVVLTAGGVFTGNLGGAANLGIPITLNGALGTSRVQFTLNYDSNLLNVANTTFNGPLGSTLTLVGAPSNVGVNSSATFVFDRGTAIPFGAEQQRLVFNNTTGSTAGTFRLAFNPGAGIQTTGAITYDANVTTLATNIQNALNALPGGSLTGNINVRAVTGVGGAAFEGPLVDMFFVGSLVGVNVAQVTVPGGTTSLGGATLSNSPVVNGDALPLGTLGYVVAAVPDAAAGVYRAKQLLRLSNISSTGAAATPVGNDGVHVVAYFGDASGTGDVSGGDSGLISRVGSQTDGVPGTTQVGGFAAYRLLDPVIVGDLNLGGTVDASDTGLINAYQVKSQTQIPVPSTSTSLVFLFPGPDPYLSLPSDLKAAAGEAVVVPVNLDTARPEYSPGMTEAVLALRFDPKVFTVSASDISLGSIPNAGSGWQIRSVVNNQTGEIGIDMFSMTPITSRTGGTLVNITMHVRDGAVAGPSAVNLVSQVNPTSMATYRTYLADPTSVFVLSPLVTNGYDPGVDGRVTIPASAAMFSTSVATIPQAFVVTPDLVVGDAGQMKSFAVAQAGVYSDMPEAMMEEIFSAMQESGFLMEAGGQSKHEALLDSGLSEKSLAARDQALLWEAEEGHKQSWLSDDQLSRLSKNARRRKLMDGLDADEAEEVDGVDAYFADQG